MSNMSYYMFYYMFQNILQELRQCAERLEEIGYNLDKLPEKEQQAARCMISICRDIAEQYSETN